MTRAKRKLIGRVDPETGEITPTDGRNRKKKSNTECSSDTDYKKLYEKLASKCEALEALIASLKKQIRQLEEKG